ncbi:Apolipophorin-3 [Eumeta japonica]|uniref:Apolipophorin-3 n=1 Tax=Eumeta variegata TaxID=151549 RepID=A0A4C1Y979_EUMVA|nr:Apolipophorin-3 [Eumeta japonica]
MNFHKKLCAAAVSVLLGCIGRWSGREIARSALSLARSAQAERDNESCFFVTVQPYVVARRVRLPRAGRPLAAASWSSGFPSWCAVRSHALRSVVTRWPSSATYLNRGMNLHGYRFRLTEAAVTESANDSGPFDFSAGLKADTISAHGTARTSPRRARSTSRTLSARRPRTAFTMIRLVPLTLAAFCLLQAQAYVSRRDAPDALEDVLRQAQEFHNTFGEHLKTLVISKKTQVLYNRLFEQSFRVLQRLSELSSELESGPEKQALDEAFANIERQVDELQEKFKAQKLAEKVHKNAEETDQNLTPRMKDTYSIFVVQDLDVQQPPHEAADEQ